MGHARGFRVYAQIHYHKPNNSTITNTAFLENIFPMKTRRGWRQKHTSGIQNLFWKEILHQCLESLQHELLNLGLADKAFPDALVPSTWKGKKKKKKMSFPWGEDHVCLIYSCVFSMKDAFQPLSPLGWCCKSPPSNPCWPDCCSSGLQLTTKVQSRAWCRLHAPSGVFEWTNECNMCFINKKVQYSIFLFLTQFY